VIIHRDTVVIDLDEKGFTMTAVIIQLKITHSLPENSSLNGQQMYWFDILLKLARGFLASSLWMDVLVIAEIGFLMNALRRESIACSSHRMQPTKSSRQASRSSGCRKGRQLDADYTQTFIHNRQKSLNLCMVVKDQLVLIISLLPFVKLELEPSGA
jgi:hypothetical protein